MELTAEHRAALLEELETVMAARAHNEGLTSTLRNETDNDASVMAAHEIEHYLIIERKALIKAALRDNQIDY